MKKFFIVTVALGAAVAFSIGLSHVTTSAPQQVISGAQDAAALAPAVATVPFEHYVLQEDDTFAQVLQSFGVGYGDITALVEQSAQTYDFTSIRAGQPLRILTKDGKLLRLEYEKDREEMVRAVRENDGFVVSLQPIAYDVTRKRAIGVIDSSFYLAGLSAGITDETILEFADVFGWTIDFATQVRVGDSFKVLYEKRTRDGSDAGSGRILAGEFVNQGKTFRAYLFKNEEGKPAYFDEQGNAMVRQFLKAPLRYNRISSGYSYARFHPVTGKTTPHRAIDYAAPLGTPILATADGMVTYAGWNGGYGNYIDIRHNSIYETQYAHLSGYAKGIKRGVRVAQGDVIGYVGSTGYSTGPHLHYQIKYNGQLVNPLEIELPSGDPVPQELRQEFEQTKQELSAQLDAQ